MNNKRPGPQRVSHFLIAVVAVLTLALSSTAPASAAPKNDSKSKHYVLKGGTELLTSDQFGDVEAGEKHHFVLNNRTGETYYMGTGPVDSFVDERKALYKEHGRSYEDVQISPTHVAPYCNFSTLCLIRKAPFAQVAIGGFDLTWGSWSSVYRIETGIYSGRWYENNHPTLYTQMGPNRYMTFLIDVNVTSARQL